MTSDFKWGLLIVECVRQIRESTECVQPFVDSEVIPPFDGSPDDIFVWFICDTIASKDRFRVTDLSNATRRVRSLAVEAGFPTAAIATLRSDVTSEEDIENGGGKFYFFR